MLLLLCDCRHFLILYTTRDDTVTAFPYRYDTISELWSKLRNISILPNVYQTKKANLIKMEEKFITVTVQIKTVCKALPAGWERSGIELIMYNEYEGS